MCTTLTRGAFAAAALITLLAAFGSNGAPGAARIARAGDACVAYQTPYVGVLGDTTLSGGGNTINYPIGQTARPGEYFDLVIDFGDGATDDLYSDNSTSDNASHTYTDAGTYTVRITGTGVAMIPDACEFPYDYTWTVIVQQGLTGAPPTPQFNVATSAATSPAPAPTEESPGDPAPAVATTVADNPSRPDMVKSVPGPNDISREPDVIVTNLGFMGFTLLVIFVAAQIFNSTLSENRAEIERSLDRVSRPVRTLANRAQGALPFASGQSSLFQRYGWSAVVVVLTVAIYGFTDPAFPTGGSSSLVVITSVLLCVAAVTYLTEGGAAYYQRTRLGQQIGLRPFPFAIAIAAANVALARAVDFGPGVIFGFVATAVYLRPSTLIQEQQGRVTVIALALLFALSMLAWMLVIPFRAWSEDSASSVSAFFEGAAVVVFSGGIQSLAFSMIPLSFMAGEKVLKWNPAAWLGLSAVSAFLFWHVLINGDESYMEAVTSTVSVAAICVLLGAVVLTAVTWLYFRRRRTTA